MRYAVKRERREGKDEEGCSKTSGHFSFKDDGDDVVVTSLFYTVPIELNQQVTGLLNLTKGSQRSHCKNHQKSQKMVLKKAKFPTNCHQNF